MLGVLTGLVPPGSLVKELVLVLELGLASHSSWRRCACDSLASCAWGPVCNRRSVGMRHSGSVRTDSILLVRIFPWLSRRRFWKAGQYGGAVGCGHAHAPVCPR